MREVKTMNEDKLFLLPDGRPLKRDRLEKS